MTDRTSKFQPDAHRETPFKGHLLFTHNMLDDKSPKYTVFDYRRLPDSFNDAARPFDESQPCTRLLLWVRVKSLSVEGILLVPLQKSH